MDLKENKYGIEKNKKFYRSLKCACAGLKVAFVEERNLRFQCVLGILAVLAGFFFELERFEWLWILLAIFLVITMELLNTVMENLVDMITEKTYHPIGKKVKDIGAAVVFINACFAVLIAGIIFLPKLVLLLQKFL